MAQVGPDALDPPVEAVPLEDVPAVERVPPELPRLAEVVGRDARHAHRVARLVQLEDLGVRPDVGAVGRDVDRDVAEDPDPPLVRRLLHAVPLAEEEELEEDVPGDVVGQLALDARESRRLAAAQLLGPLPERRPAVSPLQRHEEGPVGQPVLLGRRFAEPLELGPQVPRARRRGSASTPRAGAPPSRRPPARSRPGAPESPGRARAPSPAGARRRRGARGRGASGSRRRPRACRRASSRSPSARAAGPARRSARPRPPSRGRRRTPARGRRCRSGPEGTSGGGGVRRRAFSFRQSYRSGATLRRSLP